MEIDNWSIRYVQHEILRYLYHDRGTYVFSTPRENLEGHNYRTDNKNEATIEGE